MISHVGKGFHPRMRCGLFEVTNGLAVLARPVTEHLEISVCKYFPISYRSSRRELAITVR